MLEEFMVRSNYIQLACLDETAQRDLYTEMTAKKHKGYARQQI